MFAHVLGDLVLGKHFCQNAKRWGGGAMSSWGLCSHRPRVWASLPPTCHVLGEPFHSHGSGRGKISPCLCPRVTPSHPRHLLLSGVPPCLCLPPAPQPPRVCPCPCSNVPGTPSGVGGLQIQAPGAVPSRRGPCRPSRSRSIARAPLQSPHPAPATRPLVAGDPAPTVGRMSGSQGGLGSREKSPDEARGDGSLYHNPNLGTGWGPGGCCSPEALRPAALLPLGTGPQPHVGQLQGRNPDGQENGVGSFGAESSTSSGGHPWGAPNLVTLPYVG